MEGRCFACELLNYECLWHVSNSNIEEPELAFTSTAFLKLAHGVSSRQNTCCVTNAHNYSTLQSPSISASVKRGFSKVKVNISSASWMSSSKCIMCSLLLCPHVWVLALKPSSLLHSTTPHHFCTKRVCLSRATICLGGLQCHSDSKCNRACRPSSQLPANHSAQH